MLNQLHCFYSDRNWGSSSRNYGVCSDLWGMFGTMGYARNYGVCSKLWVCLERVILGIMGHSRNYGACVFPNVSQFLRWFIALLVQCTTHFFRIKKILVSCYAMDNWTRVFGSKHWGLSTNFLGVPCWN